MADKPADTSATSTDRVRIVTVSQDKVSLQFLVEDLVQQLLRPIQAASCMGCKGCMASRF